MTLLGEQGIQLLRSALIVILERIPSTDELYASVHGNDVADKDSS
jgi:hypothetical protein